MCQHNVEQDCHEPVSDLQCVKLNVQMVGAKFEPNQLGLLTWEQAEFKWFYKLPTVFEICPEFKD